VVLFYHGAAAEVPRGRVIVVFNPFRNRDSENTAGRVIRDVRTEDCQPVVQSLSGGKDYDPRVCLVMGKTGNHNLIWREDREQSRVLVYDIAEQPARLWITFPVTRAGLRFRRFLLCAEASLTPASSVITIVITEAAMVELKVRKFGNSLGVVLPKDVINRLQTGDGQKLFLIEAAGGDYRLTPYDPAFEEQMEKAQEIMSRYRNTLRALAK
jgi:putative addiction module antidote